MSRRWLFRWVCFFLGSVEIVAVWFAFYRYVEEWPFESIMIQLNFAIAAVWAASVPGTFFAWLLAPNNPKYCILVSTLSALSFLGFFYVAFVH